MSFITNQPLHVLDELSEKLLQSYEESSLAYKLSGAAEIGRAHV